MHYQAFMERTAAPATLAEVLLEIWPQGVPQAELEHHARLSLEARTAVLKRLLAIRRFENETGEVPITAKLAATAAGVSVPRLYAMASAWRSSRSIAALGRFAAPRASGRKSATVNDPGDYNWVAEKLVALDAEIGVAEFTDFVSKSLGAKLPRSTARRLLLKARRSLPPQSFGRRIIFDSAGLDASAEGERLRLFAVIDDGSGLVVGWTIAPNSSRAWGHLQAARKGLDWLLEANLTSFDVWARPTTVEVHAQGTDGFGCGALSNRLAAAGIECDTTFEGLGRKLIETVGDRFGGIWAGVGERQDRVSYRTARYDQVSRIRRRPFGRHRPCDTEAQRSAPRRRRARGRCRRRAPSASTRCSWRKD